MKKLKYALDVHKFLNDDGDMTLLCFKYFKTKKEALVYANERGYLDCCYFYTKLWIYNDYIMLT